MAINRRYSVCVHGEKNGNDNNRHAHTYLMNENVKRNEIYVFMFDPVLNCCAVSGGKHVGKMWQFFLIINIINIGTGIVCVTLHLVSCDIWQSCLVHSLLCRLNSLWYRLSSTGKSLECILNNFLHPVTSTP